MSNVLQPTAPSVVKRLLADEIIRIHEQTHGVYPLPAWVQEVKDQLTSKEGAKVEIVETSITDRTRV